MKTKIISWSIFFSLSTLVGIAQTVERRPVNNQTVGTGSVIDAREVADPTLASDKSRRATNVSTEAPSETLKRLSNAGFSLSGYQLEQINPIVRKLDVLFIKGIDSIRIVDVRPDPYKIGFKPVDYAQRKKGIGSIALQVKQGLTNWLNEDVLSPSLRLDSTSNRQLVLVVNKCWLSHRATKIYTASNPQLLQSLAYDIDVYSSMGAGYFPQKKLSGIFIGQYKSDDPSTSILFDSLVTVLRTEISSIQYWTKEKDDKLIAAGDFNAFYNEQRNKLKRITIIKKGVYTSYDDFLAQRVSSDSVEIIVKYNNAGRSPLYACQLMQLNEKSVSSAAQNWGYSDGYSLFLNLGGGFYARMLRSGGDFVFYWLNNMREDRIKPSVAEGIVVGKSSFNVIKDYARVMPLTYQLDPLSGTLE